MKSGIRWVFALSVLCPSAAFPLSRFVDPFIGTGGNGHCTPAATVPFGMVQPGPDCWIGDWYHSSGYHHGDSEILGFSQTHLSGTGGGEYGDVQIVPFCEGTYCLDGCDFDKKTERASPGYYAVELKAYGVSAEMTASDRVSVYRFRYQPGRRAHLLINLPFAVHPRWGKRYWLSHEEKVESDQVLSGVYERMVWATRRVGWTVEFGRKASAIHRIESVGNIPPRFDCVFDLSDGESLEVRVAVSRKGADGAARNLASSKGKGFDEIRSAARNRWNELLGRIEIEGDEREKRIFYTALYHLAFQPNLMTDIGEPPLYATLSLWDVHRAAYPLYMLFAPELIQPLVDTFMYFYEKQGYLPVFTLGDCEVRCMIGEHSIPILEEWRKCGAAPAANWNAIADAVEATLAKTLPNRGGTGGFQYDVFNRYGFLPHDKVRGQSVSRTLEACLDYQAAADMCEALGRKMAAADLADKARGWTNLFDRTTGFFRGRFSDGTWKEPFDPLRCDHGSTVGGEYTEGNAWQYRWHVMQHPEALVECLGGREKTALELDRLFSLKSSVYGNDCLVDVTGLIGQYAHGNEPCHHVPYLYQYAGRSDRVSERVSEICRTFYSDAPDGLCGNDDCGQMSAWYVFSVLGFYPMNPCSGNYVIGAPQVRRARIKLPKGKVLLMTADGLSNENRYVGSVDLNGCPIDGFLLQHKDIVAGGNLVFEMSPKK